MTIKVGDFCKKGHKIEGDNAQHYMNRGITPAVRCFQCTMSSSAIRPRTKEGDLCSKGHVIAGQNMKLVKHKGDGKTYLKCVICFRESTRDRQRAWRDTPQYQEYLARRREADEAKQARSNEVAFKNDVILAEEVKKTNGSYTGLNYLRLGKRAQRAWEPLEKAFDNSRGNCYRNPADYIDYEEDFEPTRVQAYKLCEECPMLVECGRFASAYKPVVGVWGGEVWKNGKVVGK
jgi:hypothetical protein